MIVENIEKYRDQKPQHRNFELCQNENCCNALRNKAAILGENGSSIDSAG